MATSHGNTTTKEPFIRDNANPAETTASKSPRSMPDKVLYEQPLNERIRTFLRLEYLFEQTAYHLASQSQWDSRATLACILEIFDLFGNTNLKSEAIKELERHSENLKRHANNPEIDHGQLSSLLEQVNSCMEDMHTFNGQIANELRNSEFLTSIRQRSAIPGGTCDFDLPAYHYWLQQSARDRSRDLAQWLTHFEPIGQAIQLILALTRNSTPMKPVVAISGMYQRTLDANLPFQLIRIALPSGRPYFAELSGGRHRFTARFLQFSTGEDRHRQTDQDVEFELACCVI